MNTYLDGYAVEEVTLVAIGALALDEVKAEELVAIARLVRLGSGSWCDGTCV